MTRKNEIKAIKQIEPQVFERQKSLRMDGLCQLTARSQPPPVYLPEPDYDDPIMESQDRKQTRSRIPAELQSITKDIQMKSKQDILKRPEFLAKQHQMRANAAKRQEEKDAEQSNELLNKLKSRSQQIDKKEEEEKDVPEFMKLKLKSKQTT